MTNIFFCLLMMISLSLWENFKISFFFQKKKKIVDKTLLVLTVVLGVTNFAFLYKIFYAIFLSGSWIFTDKKLLKWSKSSKLGKVTTFTSTIKKVLIRS